MGLLLIIINFSMSVAWSGYPSFTRMEPSLCRDFPAAANYAVLNVKYTKICNLGFIISPNWKVFVITYLFVEAWEDLPCSPFVPLLKVLWSRGIFRLGNRREWVSAQGIYERFSSQILTWYNSLRVHKARALPSANRTLWCKHVPGGFCALSRPSTASYINGLPYLWPFSFSVFFLKAKYPNMCFYRKKRA